MEQRKEKLKKEIREIHKESKQTYGAPKICRILRKNGEIISERTVGKYMREIGIKANWVKPWIRTTEKSDFSSELKNVLERDFNPKKPNAVWVSDITYIWTEEGFVYLTSVMDLFSRKIVGWTLSDNMEVSRVIETINKAKIRRGVEKATKEMVRSYSKKGNPWDNACIESFHSLIKREWLSRFRIESYDTAYSLVFEYIEAFYNTVRVHSHCDYMSPNEYEKLYKKLSKKYGKTS